MSEGEMRTYRISRIAAAVLDDARFERPSDFDLAAFWAESSAAYERAVPRIAVRVRVAPHRMVDLGDVIGGATAAGAEVLDEADADGWTRLRLQIDWPEEAPGRLLAMGGDLEVLDPLEIRDRLVTLASGALARHVTPA
jgi:predicted DNA-binding transcriptional regulator YafY